MIGIVLSIKILCLKHSTQIFSTMILIDTEKSGKTLRSQFLLKFHIKFAKVLGIYPLQSRYKKWFYDQVYASMILTIFITVSIWAAVKRVIVDTNVDFKMFLNASTSIALVFFFLAILKNSVYNRISWKIFNQNLCDFDDTCVKVQIFMNRRIWKRFVFFLVRLLVLSHIFINHTIWSMQTRHRHVNPIIYCPQYIGFFYALNVVTFIQEILTVLVSRYCYLEEALANILKRYSSRNMTILKLDWNEEITIIKKQYKLLSDAIQALNVIFGLTILFFLIHVDTTLLCTFNWLLIVIPNYTIEIYLSTCFMPVTSVVS